MQGHTLHAQSRVAHVRGRAGVRQPGGSSAHIAEKGPLIILGAVPGRAGWGRGSATSKGRTDLGGRRGLEVPSPLRHRSHGARRKLARGVVVEHGVKEESPSLLDIEGHKDCFLVTLVNVILPREVDREGSAVSAKGLHPGGDGAKGKPEGGPTH